MVGNHVTIILESDQAEQLLNLIQSGKLDGIGIDRPKKIRDAIAASILRHKRDVGQFDVFLCHNSINKPEVKKIGKKLKQLGLLPWLDEWELRPGIPWQRTLEKQIESIKAAVVFVGRDGRGPWQELELEAFIRQFVSRQCPVIPVLLKSRPAMPPPLPPLLGGMTYVDLSKKRPDPLEQIVWGITGIHPDLEPLYVLCN